MKYVTGYFYPESRHSFLVLQQLTRRRGKVPIVFAFVGEAEFDAEAEALTEWFYEKVLPCCTYKNPEKCVNLVQELLRVRVENKKGNYAALCAVDNECFYAWRGDAQIGLMNKLFNRPHCKKLTRFTDVFCVERVQIQPGVVLFLGNWDFQIFHEIPQREYFENNGQVDRYLKEIANVYANSQNQDKATILIIAQNERGRG